MYKPADYQEPFHASLASERLILGGNRSGKTMSAMIEVARAATGQDPHGKFPEKDGVGCLVGRDWKHCGTVLYPMLFKPGAFQIIKDEKTKQWRSFNPDTDSHRMDDRKPAPPLIPERMIKKMSWQMKSANYLNSCELTNGWVIYFYSSESYCPQGASYNFACCDEEIQNDSWLPELQARLADRKGRLFVAAMPHSTAEWLVHLSERAEAAEKTEGPKNIEQFRFRFLDNAHIDSEEKTKMIERWSAQGADVLRQRAEGEFTFDTLSVYPQFSMYTHGYNREDLPDRQVPPDWTRYLAIDPGHQVAAAIFFAVPPDEDMWLFYDEVYVRQANSKSFAEAVAMKLAGTIPQAMLIDGHGGRLRDIGTGRQVGVQYTDAFRDAGIKSVETGHSFLLGCDDIAARVGATQAAMTVRPSGTPRLRVLRNACPNLEREMKRYRKKTIMVNGLRVPQDAPNKKGECHLCDCLEYAVASEPRYHKPKEILLEKPVHPLVAAYEKKQKARTGSQCVFEPAGVSLGGTIDVNAFH